MMMNENGNGIQNFVNVLTSTAFTSYFLQAAQTRPVVATQLAGSRCPSPLWERRNTTWVSFSRCKIYPKCPEGVNVKNLQANWYKAEQYCRFHGMHLARSVLVMDCIQSCNQSCNLVFISLLRFNTGGVF